MKRTRKLTRLAVPCMIGLMVLGGCGSAETTVSESAESTESSAVEATSSAADGTVETITPADAFAGGSGTENDPYQIATAEQLAFLGVVADSRYDNAVDYFDSYYVLTDDIYLNDTSDYDNWGETAPEYAWIPITSHSGVHLDGQDHYIYGMYINDASAQMYYAEDRNHSADTRYEAGLFGDLSDGEIRNINLEQAYIDVDSCSDVGTLVGCASDSVVSKYIVTSTLCTGGQCNLGGIIGTQYGGEISDGSFKFGGIYLEEGISSSSVIGGVVGYSTGSVLYCADEGMIENASSEHLTIGGIVGSASAGENSLISGCDNKAELSGASPVGGIIGSLSGGSVTTQNCVLTVENCLNDGHITVMTGDGVSYGAGGIIGSLSDFGDNTLAVTGCVNYVPITGESYVGGIIGDMNNGGSAWSFENCTNKGAVTGTNYVGGIIGYVERPGTDITVAGCSNEAEVHAEDSCVGGIIGGFTSINLGTSENTPVFTVETCMNSGKVSSNEGILGTGGIVGGTESGVDEPLTLVINRCLNSGEVYAAQFAHIGGILGGTEAAVANTVIEVQMIDCGNTGSIGLGDQSAAYSELAESGEESSTDEKTILYLGGSCAGGIVGMAENTSIENCVNTGILRLDASMYSDECYVGSIVGQYRYSDENEYADDIGVRNCVYSTQEAAYSPNNLTPDVLAEMVSDVSQVSEAEAEALLAEIAQ